MEITFLGTSSMVPTKERNHSAILLTYKAENILVDCGEGTQRQFRIAGISPMKVTRLLITHWHGDHVLGIPGLIQTLGANGYSKALEVYGPRGTPVFIERMLRAFVLQEKVQVKVHEITGEGKFLETEDFYIEAYGLEHTSPCLGYRFVEKDKLRINMEKLSKLGLKPGPILKHLQRGKDIEWKGKNIKAEDVTSVKKGKKVAIATDTLYCSNLVKLAKDTDLFISEATLEKDMADKAIVTKHMTSVQAAEAAKKAKAKKLVLTHFSQRYRSVSKLKKEAREVFKQAECAEDFMRIKL
ncbi:MAG: ribonuclease Z [Candidatus Woesearchaeota archaeon]